MTLLAFFIAFSAFLLLILNFLPTGSLPTEVIDSVEYVIGAMKAWDFLLPVDTLLSAVLVVAVADLALVGWWGVKWIIGLVRGGTS